MLQINSVCGYGSTGRIATDIADMLQQNGHECRIVYGRGDAPEKYKDISFCFGNRADNILHGLKTRLFDLHGFGSKQQTKKLLKWIDDYNPDLIHLHNIHGYYIHIGLLFDYLKKSKKSVIWTLHDCWAMTGHCAHFSAIGCAKYKTECNNCPQLNEYPSTLYGGNVKNNFLRKKSIFTGVENLTLVTPSYWLADVTRDSFLGEYPVKPIYNGVDLNVFKPTESDFRKRYSLEKKTMILGVASVWTHRKGLDDFVKLSKLLDDSFKIVLVGLNDSQIKELPESIIKIKRTNSVKELAEIYSAADVYINPSVEETMGLTTAEALACGTPVIVYNKTAVPEVPDEKCGIVVSCSPEEIAKALGRLNFSKSDCLERAKMFEKNIRYQEYLHLYCEKVNFVR